MEKRGILYVVLGVIIGFLIVALAFMIKGLGTNIKSIDERKEYVRVVKGVSHSMLKAKYWIDLQKNEKEVIMPLDEILLWNKSLHKDMKVAGSVYHMALEEPLQDKNIKYGIMTSRASIREMPTDEQVISEKGEEFFCELQVSSILMNEPVLIIQQSMDEEWYYITCRYCSGWVRCENVAVCENWQQWKSANELEEFLLITGNKEVIEVDMEEFSEVILYMGTKLPLVKYTDYDEDTNGDRTPYECYIVRIPFRDGEGMLMYHYGFVPVSRDVNVGYLQYTKENLISQMFKINGDRYGWGGMYNSRDCSQYVMDVYSLFGFEFARNSAAQAGMPFDGYDVSKMTDEEKYKVLEDVPIGSLIYFEGHIMLYLGQVGKEHYVISETARIMENENVLNAHSCMITPLSVKRPNGKAWISEVSVIMKVR